MNHINYNEIEFFQPSPLFRGLLILIEIEKDASITQKRLSNKVGLTSSMINNYLKDFVHEGIVEYRGETRRQTTYFLTPKGKQQMENLLKRYLQETVGLFKKGKEIFVDKIRHIADSGIKRVILFGALDTGEILFTACQALGLNIIGIVDSDTKKHGKEFFGRTILAPGQIKFLDPDAVIITSLGHGEEMYKSIKHLEEVGVKIIKLI